MTTITMTPTADAEELDAALASPSLLVRIAGRVALVSGVFTLLLGVQTLSNLRFAGLWAVVPVLQLVCGAGLAVSGWKLSRARGWAAISATALGALTALGTTTWTVMALLAGYVSLLSFMVVLGAVASAVMAGITIGECRRADGARARLEEQGLNLGL